MVKLVGQFGCDRVVDGDQSDGFAAFLPAAQVEGGDIDVRAAPSIVPNAPMKPGWSVLTI
jgi:hypothetical protein